MKHHQLSCCLILDDVFLANIGVCSMERGMSAAFGYLRHFFAADFDVTTGFRIEYANLDS